MSRMNETVNNEVLDKIASNFKRISVESRFAMTKFDIDYEASTISFNELNLSYIENPDVKELQEYPNIKILVAGDLIFFKPRIDITDEILNHFDLSKPYKIEFTQVNLKESKQKLNSSFAVFKSCQLKDLTNLQENVSVINLHYSELGSFKGIHKGNGLTALTLDRMKIDDFDELPETVISLMLQSNKEGKFKHSLRWMLVKASMISLINNAPQLQLLKPFFIKGETGDIYGAAAALIESGYEECATL